MLTSSRVIWYITHRERMILKIWPHLTFDRKWPCNSITDDKKYPKLYIFGILVVSGVVWGITRGGQTILKIWPHLTSPVTPIYKMKNWTKKMSKCCLLFNCFETTLNSFFTKWLLSTSCTDLFNLAFRNFILSLSILNLKDRKKTSARQNLKEQYLSKKHLVFASGIW